MAYHNNPKIVTDGLIFCIDGASKKSYPTDNNLLNPGTWIAGTTGSQTGFTRNGSESENSIVLDTDPFGNTANIWKATPLGNNNPDGGWNTSTFNIDNTKMYRYSVWVKKSNNTLASGRFYLGLNGYGSTDGVYYRSNGENNTNPYFYSTATLSSGIDQWELIVGHVWPVGSGTGDIYIDSGRYNTSGEKLGGTTDYVWRSETTTSRHRSYLFYNTDGTSTQHWAYPRVDIIDGTEPSIQQLINNDINALYVKDLVSDNKNRLLDNVGYSTNNRGFFEFDGVNSRIYSNLSYSNLSAFTLSCWVYPISLTNSYGIIIGTEVGNNMYSAITLQSTNKIYFFGYQENNVFIKNIDLNNWYHITCAYENGNITAFVNGILEKSSSYNKIYSTSNTNIGRATAKYLDSYRAFQGKIAGIQVYNRAISIDENLQNYNAHKSRFGL